MHLIKPKAVYITDGNNTYIQNQDIRKLIDPIITKKKVVEIIPVENNYQIKKDRCGSAAVLAALEFQRWYKTKIGQPQLMSASKIMHDQVHKMPRTKCVFCRLNFKQNANKLAAHTGHSINDIDNKH